MRHKLLVSAVNHTVHTIPVVLPPTVFNYHLYSTNQTMSLRLYTTSIKDNRQSYILPYVKICLLFSPTLPHLQKYLYIYICLLQVVNFGSVINNHCTLVVWSENYYFFIYTTVLG